MPDPLAPLIDMARQGVPFTAFDGQAFVRLSAPASEGFYILPVRSRTFHAILNHLEAEADHSEQNQRLAVWRRVGSRGSGRVPAQILLNLANPDCEFVEISPAGWKTTTGAGALLQTSRSTLSLPAPATPSPASNPLETLRSCLNLPSRADWLRCLAWLLAALRPDGPFPALSHLNDIDPPSGRCPDALAWAFDPRPQPIEPAHLTAS